MFSGVGKHIDFKFDIHKDESAEIVSNLVANKLVQEAQAEEIQLLLEKVIERVKETPAGNIQVFNKYLHHYVLCIGYKLSRLPNYELRNMVSVWITVENIAMI